VKPDRPQNDGTAANVIAQPPPSSHCNFISCKAKIRRVFEKKIILFFTIF